MKKFYPYIIFVIISIFLCLLLFPFITRWGNIFSESDCREYNTLTITMHDSPNAKSYGNEMRIKSLIVNGQRINLGDISNESWVWHPEWDYILFQEGEHTLEIPINEVVHKIELIYIEQEGSGKCTISFNGEAVKNVDMYSNNWHESIYSVAYYSDFEMIMLELSVGVIVFCLIYLIYIIILVLTGRKKVTGFNVGIGTFDFVKGVAILAVILGHTGQAILSDNKPHSLGIVGIILEITAIYTIIPVFLIVSGYGFRGRDTKSVVKKQLRIIMITIGLFAAIVLAIDILKVILIPNLGMSDLIMHMLSILTMQLHEKSILGYYFVTIGPLWFVVSLGIAKIIFNEILKIKSERKRLCVMLIILCVICFACKLDITVFSFGAALSSLPYLYTGYLLGKYKIFKRNKIIIGFLFGAGVIVFYVLAFCNGITFSIAGNSFGNNFLLGVIASVIGGVIIVRELAILGITLGKRVQAIKVIGKESFFILFAHSIECVTIPWTELMTNFELAFWFKILIFFVIRLIIVFALTKVILFVVKRYHSSFSRLKRVV